MPEVYRRLTYTLDRLRENNNTMILRLARAYQLAATALAAEVLALVALLSGSLG